MRSHPARPSVSGPGEADRSYPSNLMIAAKGRRNNGRDLTIDWGADPDARLVGVQVVLLQLDGLTSF